MGKKHHQVCVKLTGDIDGACNGKNAWNDAVRTFVPWILDINVIEWEHHKTESVNKLREALHSEFEFVGRELSRQGFCNAIKRFLKGERLRLKAKYLAGHIECPLHVQPAQWETLKEYWAVDGSTGPQMRVHRQPLRVQVNVRGTS
jgi:hypothetical protein